MKGFFKFILILYALKAFMPFLNEYGISLPLEAYFTRLAGSFLLIYILHEVTTGRLHIHYLHLFFLFIIITLAIIHYDGENFVYGNYQPELFVHIRFWCFIVLGYNLFLLTEFKKFFISFLFIAIILNIISIALTPTFLRELIQGKTLTYKLQYTLMPAFFFLFHVSELEKKERRIVIIACCLYIIEQILFQKRLPLARIGFILFLLTIFSSYLSVYKTSIRDIIAKYFSFTLLGIVLGITLLTVGLNIPKYISATIDRFYVYGSLQESIEEDDRWLIGETIMEDIEKSDDMILGRGFGGVVFDDSFQMKTEDGKAYRFAAEMGVPTIFLKGGYTLFFVILLIILKCLISFKYIKNSQLGISMWVTVFIWVIFMYWEGYIGLEQSLQEVLIAYCIGGTMLATKVKHNWNTLFNEE